MTTPSPSLRHVALSGARWTGLARLVAELATLASAVVLARLIPPADFGRAAVALIVIALTAVLGTAGLVAPLVQRRDLDRRHVTSATFLAFLCGMLMTAATAGFGLVFAESIFGEATARLIVLASPAWLLVGIGVSSQAMMQRELRFRAQALIEGFSAMLGVAVSLGLAFAGFDATALVAGALTLVGAMAILSFASAPPGWPIPARRELTELCRFAAPVAGSSLAYLAYRNVDYAILGARVSPAQVGYYWRAYQLGVGYQSKISRVMLRLSLPLFSRAAEMTALRRMRSRIVRTHATVLVPLLMTFIGVAPLLVPWLFGDAWEPAVVPSQILAVAGIADAVMTGSGPLLVAIGRPGALVKWNLLQLVLYTLLVLLLAPHGITVLAVGVALFGLANAVGVQSVLLRRYLDLSLRDLWLDVRAGTVMGGVVLVATTLLRVTLEALDVPDFLALVLLGLAALALGAAVLRLLYPSEWNDVAAIVGLESRARPTEGSPSALTVRHPRREP
jgi:O-antigen/teichoic acid export membrane protein